MVLWVAASITPNSVWAAGWAAWAYASNSVANTYYSAILAVYPNYLYVYGPCTNLNTNTCSSWNTTNSDTQNIYQSRTCYGTQTYTAYAISVGGGGSYVFYTNYSPNPSCPITQTQVIANPETITAPSITGNSATISGAANTFTFSNTTDNKGNLFHYEISWSNSGTKDETLPSSSSYSLTNAAPTATITHSWTYNNSGPNTHTFGVRAVSSTGAASTWTPYTVSVCVGTQGASCPSPLGVCNTTYSDTVQCDGSCNATTPPLPPNGYGTNCNRNTCGGTGTYTCGGGSNTLYCSAQAPSIPSNLGNPCNRNSCDSVPCPGGKTCSGDGIGVWQCDTTCSQATKQTERYFSDGHTVNQSCLSAPNACGQSTYNGVWLCNDTCSSIPDDSQCPAPTVDITNISKQMVNPGNSCSFSWSVTNAGNQYLTNITCSITAPGMSTVSVPTTGTWTTSPISYTTRYTLSCINGPKVTTSKILSCLINPNFREL